MKPQPNPQLLRELQQRFKFLADLGHQLPDLIRNNDLPVWPYEVMLDELSRTESLVRNLLDETYRARLYHNHPDRVLPAATPSKGQCGWDDSR